ncbi:hypothetical protein ACIPYR_02620 [Streptomyces parvus]
MNYRRTGELPIFPPFAPTLAALPTPRATVAALETVTNHNYTWV